MKCSVCGNKDPEHDDCLLRKKGAIGELEGDCLLRYISNQLNALEVISEQIDEVIEGLQEEDDGDGWKKGQT